MEEKRKNKRLDLSVDIELERLDQDGITTLKYAHVEVTDISRTGIGFNSKTKLALDSFYNTKIQIWTGEILNTVLEIVRESGDGIYRYGGKFVGMTDVDALKIDIYQIFNDI